jgi:transporter family protein
MQAYVFAFITIVFWGISPILEKLGLMKLDPTVAIAVRSFAISLCLFVYLLGSGRLQELLTVDARSLIYVAGAGICAGLLGHAAYYYALKYGEASRIVPLTGSFPLLTVTLAILLLGESLTWTKFTGALFVVVGIVLLKL